MQQLYTSWTFCKCLQNKERSRQGKVNFIESDENEYAYSVKSKDEFEKIEVTAGGQKIPMIVDSGLSANIIECELWRKLKEKKIECNSRLEPLQQTASVGGCTTEAEFIVINGHGEPWLGRSTATKLGVLKIGPSVMNIKNSTQVVMSTRRCLRMWVS